MSVHSVFSIYDQKRREWQNPEALLVEIGSGPGSTFMDIGCGDGFFALPAARLVGDNGRVHALDINREAIRRLKESATKQGLQNLNLVVGRAEDTILCEACADIVFFGIVLHDFDDPARVLVNARRMLTPDGKLVNLDWKKEQMPFGPPLQKRFDEEQAKRLITQAGFNVESVRESGPYHYLIIARPRSG